MRILISAYGCNPTKGGEGQKGWYCGHLLAKRGHEVWCLTTRWGQATLRDFQQRHPLPNLHFVFVDVPHWVEKAYVNDAGVYLHYLVWQQMALRRARVLDSQTPFDVVHHLSYGSLQLGTPLWQLGKPLLLGPVGGGQFPPAQFRSFFHGHWNKELLRKQISHLLRRFNPHARQAARRAALVLTTNRETRDMARQMGAQRVAYFLDAGLPAHFFSDKRTPQPAQASPTLRLLWVGRILPRKGLSLVLAALARVPADVPFSLTIIGHGPLDGSVEEWIRGAGLEDKVRWLGKKTWPEVRAAYQQHDAFIFCSLRDSFGAQLLEAMANGLPVLTLSLFGGRDVVPPGVGIKVPVADPDTTLGAIAQGVVHLARHPAERQQMGERGHAFAQTHMWQAKVRRFEAFYLEIIK